jgi:hypothetical protein
MDPKILKIDNAFFIILAETKEEFLLQKQMTSGELGSAFYLLKSTLAKIVEDMGYEE